MEKGVRYILIPIELYKIVYFIYYKYIVYFLYYKIVYFMKFTMKVENFM
jgi:hypothetical protein